MEESDNDPNRRELNYSKAYRKKYEEKFGRKDKVSLNFKGNGVSEKGNLQSNINRGNKDKLNSKGNGVSDYFNSSSTSFKSKQ